MFQISKPLFFVCETPLHAGSGSDLGIVDLPIQREKHTSFPKIESSSLKGAIREAVETKLKMPKNGSLPLIDALFGPEDAGNEAHMGALGFSDARLLLFPVKSMKGVFAWVTCPKVLDQFKRDMKIVDASFDISGDYKVDTEGVCKLLNKDESSLKIKNSKSILLEEYAFTYEKDGEESLNVKVPKFKVKKENGTEEEKDSLQDWFAENLPTEWKEKITKDIVILSNDDFKDFVNLSTEVITRNKIDNITGTVDKKIGGLFTEEFLPAETVMYSLVMAAPVFKKEQGNLDTAEKVMKAFTDVITTLPVIQIGGGATLGKGIVRTRIV